MGLLGDVATTDIETSFGVALPRAVVYELLRRDPTMSGCVTDAIDESSADAPGTVWRMRVRTRGSACWIRSRVLVDEPPDRIDTTCGPTAVWARRFVTECSYRLTEQAGGGTLVSLHLRTPASSGLPFAGRRSPSELRRVLDSGLRDWAARAATADPIEHEPDEVSGHGRKWLPAVLILVVVAAAFAGSATSHPLLVAVALFVTGWVGLMWFARRRRGSLGDPRPTRTGRAPHVRTLRHIRRRRAVMAAVTVTIAGLVAIGSHRWQNTVTAVVVVTVVQWLAVQFVTILRRWSAEP
jgi:uncharacterized membrane protein